jgi:UDP-N-acetylglucosamine 2-epimerase (non-hydrolysing)
MQRSYVVIVGARPNFVKVAPLFKRLSQYPDLSLSLVHTGQHFDNNLSQIFFDQMGIPRPDVHLDIKGEFHTEKIGRMFSALKSVVAQKKYNGVIVFGDINSTLAGAVAAVTTGNRLIHIESGLRSHDRRMPEEINRAITDHLSDMLLVSEPSGVDNLLKEGIEQSKIVYVGNIMIESIEIFRSTFNASTICDDLNLVSGEYIVSTIHRAENTDNPQVLKKIFNLLQEISVTYTVVVPLHPGTRNLLKSYHLEDMLSSLHVIEPLGYIDFMKLVMSSAGVVTDSGGIQEETTYLNIPCCTLRDNTERPVTVTHGTNKLFPIDILETASGDILDHIQSHSVSDVIPCWDDKVSQRILDLL